jgi:hypothetical protein
VEVEVEVETEVETEREAKRAEYLRPAKLAKGSRGP